MKKLISFSMLFLFLQGNAFSKSFLEFCNGSIGNNITVEEAETVAMIKLALGPKRPWPVKLDTMKVYGPNGELFARSTVQSFNGYAVPTKTKFTHKKFKNHSEVTKYLLDDVFKDKSKCAGMNEKFEKMEALQLTVGKFKLANGSLVGYPLKTITPLKGAINLKLLILNQNNLKDISVLSELKELQILKIGKNRVENLDFIKDLPNLWSFDASQNAISDLSPLRFATELKELTLSSQVPVKLSTSWVPEDKRLMLKDITALSGLKNLYFLLLGNNKIEDITPLKELHTLNYLSLKNNSIKDMASLNELKSLRNLYLSHNKIVDASVLLNFKNIKTLSMSNNKVADCTIFANFKNIIKLNFVKNPCK